ncbi:MAG: radical SAM protein [Candidatus Margulisbacteria bacterium]|jgi:radical SAM protein with 4Fe4S-binding SPASM domain|nr:radical SAM protein [Candidatus Margulisiibacteriota bacterium]
MQTKKKKEQSIFLPKKWHLSVYEILLTGHCNLRCTYCYECVNSKDTAKQRKTKREALTSAKIDDVIKFIVKTYDRNAKEVTIIFFGGEPFLAFGQMKEMISGLEYAKAEGKIKGDLRYTTTSNLTTIDLSQMYYLQAKQFSVLVSLDGLEGTTDRSRGKGTFAKVMKNMGLLHGLNIPFSIRATVVVGEEMDLVADLQFLNALKHIFWWNIDHTQSSLTSENLPQVLEQLLSFYGSALINYDKTLDKYLDATKGDRWCINPYETISIYPDGRLHPCSRIDKIIGTVREGISVWTEIKDAPFYSGHPHTTCKNCLVYFNCRGGCLGTHLEVNGTNNILEYRLNDGHCKEMFLLQLLNEELILRHQYNKLKSEKE